MRGFVVVQIALAFTLLVGAGALVRSAFAQLDRELGYDPSHLTTTIVSVFQSERLSQADPEARRTFVERLLVRLEARPEIAAATLASGDVFRAGSVPVATTPEEAGDLDRTPRARSWEVLPDFFETLRLPLLAGRIFDDADLRARSLGVTAGDDTGEATVAIVTRSFARDRLAGEAVGRRLELFPGWRPGQGAAGAAPIEAVVVGVVEDLGVDSPGVPLAEHGVFTPRPDERQGGGFALVRGSSGTGGVLAALDEEIARLDPAVGTLDHASFDSRRAEETWIARRAAQLFGVFAAASLLLTTVGLWAVVDRAVRRRRRELGIRLAVGARPADLRSMVLRDGVGNLLLGLLGAAVLLTGSRRFVEPLLREVGLWDPGALAAALLLLAGASLLACLGPAVRAARTAPAEILDAE